MAFYSDLNMTLRLYALHILNQSLVLLLHIKLKYGIISHLFCNYFILIIKFPMLSFK